MSEVPAALPGLWKKRFEALLFCPIQNWGIIGVRGLKVEVLILKNLQDPHWFSPAIAILRHFSGYDMS